MRRLFLLLLSLHLSGCAYMIPRENLPFPLTNESFDSEVKTVAIPLPVIASSPNEGITAGALAAFLLHNRRQEVGTLLVPQVNYNHFFGTTTTLYGAFYPSQERNWKLNLSHASKTNEEYRIRFQDRRFGTNRHELNLNVYQFTDGSTRFFGFEASSQKKNETNYADQELGGSVTLGHRFAGPWGVIFGERYRKVDIRRGAVPSVPFITDVFSPEGVPGVNGFQVHAQEVGILYNSLDSYDLPTTGSYARVSVDNSFRFLGSGSEFQMFKAEARGYFPDEQCRFITVVRLALSEVRGDRVPFLEQSILGGETTLRGYGQNRFIDRSYLLMNVEERIRLFRWEIFNVLADWEVAPFMDLGSVMRTVFHGREASFQFNPGVGLRTVVRPNIVGRIDVGVGREGPAVFVGLGYPF